jgi:enoyl-[acyl-carrier protein] reductase III
LVFPKQTDTGNSSGETQQIRGGLGLTENTTLSQWALILGASSGFGAACAAELSRAGLNIFGVHLDRKSTMGNVESVIAEIESAGRTAMFFNANAADDEERASIIRAMDQKLAEEHGFVRVMLHSLAFGSVRPYVRGAAGDNITRAQMEMTLDVMASSLIYWSQDLLANDMLRGGSRIFAMTSAGSTKVWPSYGAVSSAKAALESNVRQLATELAPMGITCNALRAGVTDTPALRKIPEHERMLQIAGARNPSGRLTLPQDVADAVVALMDSRTHWITGNVIAVDGGEFVVD